MSELRHTVHHMSVLEILSAYSSGALSPVQVVEHYLERIARLDPEINCVVDVLPDSALALARQAAAHYASSLSGGEDRHTSQPLLGVPFLIKEQHNLKGHSATRGSATRAGMIAEDTHPTVQRLIDAGAIPLGRTTTPEFSCATFTQTAEWGISRNPFNTDKTPGGSSGGSGGAVAAGFAPFATASDIAGSTRIPAAFNGLPGFKTPAGYTPGIHPLNADWYRGDHILARTVADTAFLTNIISGIHPLDHNTVPPETFDYDFLADPSQSQFITSPAATTEHRALAAIRGMKIAVSPNLGMYKLAPSAAAGVERVATALEKAGAIVETIDLKLDRHAVNTGSMAHFGQLIAANIGLATNGDPTVLEPYTQRFLELAQAAANETTLLETLALEQSVQDTLAQVMGGFDALVTATSATEDLDAGNLYLDPVEHAGERLACYWEGHMTVPFNMANRCPVMNLPAGLGSAGVPVGVQVVGHTYRSRPVFAIAAALEVLLPFPQAPLMRA